MKRHPSEHPMKMMVESLKQGGDYHAPGKAFVWGLAVSQWLAIVIVGGVFFSFFIYLIVFLAQYGGGAKPRKMTVDQQATNEQQIVTLKETFKFLEIAAHSVNDRQEILDRLTKAISQYAKADFNQNSLEQKVNRFWSILSSCNVRRGKYLSSFSEVINPFESPEMPEEMQKVISELTSFKIGNPAINPKEENQQWRALCDFCQNEAKNASKELAEVLNADGNTKAEMLTSN